RWRPGGHGTRVRPRRLAVGGGAWRAAAAAVPARTSEPPEGAVSVRWLALLLALTLAPGRAAAVEDPSCGTMAVVMRTDALIYPLPRAFLRTGSEAVRAHGVEWRAGTDYVLDPLRGELRLLREPIAGDTPWVDACGLLAPPPLE